MAQRLALLQAVEQKALEMGCLPELIQHRQDALPRFLQRRLVPGHFGDTAFNSAWIRSRRLMRKLTPLPKRF